jgi:YVTN family beta-propeller protein
MPGIQIAMRARLAVLLASSLAAACVALPGAARAASVFVVNSNDANVDVIDMATHRITRTIPLLREPHHLVLSPDGKSLVVGDTTGNALFFLDPVTGDVQRKVAVSDPYQLLYSPNGRFLTTAGLARNQIDIYDARTYTLLHRIPARSMPSHIAYTPDSSVVFVSLQGTNALIAIRTSDGAVLWTTKVGRTPAGVFWNHGRILVGIMGEAHISVVDPATGKLERTIPTGRGAHTMFYNLDHSLIYATNRVDGTIAVIDPQTLQVKRTLTVRGGPDDLEFEPDGKIWATLRFAQSVAVIDPATGAEERIAVGRSPHGIWMNTHLQ